jgi:nuclear GTP-binding protein
MSLIREGPQINGLKQHQAKIAIETAPFSDTFGPKAQRKRAKIGVSSMEDLAGQTEQDQDAYVEKLEEARALNGNTGAEDEEADDMGGDDGTIGIAREAVFSKGQSKRIWNELCKCFHI